MMQRVSSFATTCFQTDLIYVCNTERMGDGEYEFADDGKLFKPPAVKLLSAKVKSAPAKGLVSTLTPSAKITFLLITTLLYRIEPCPRCRSRLKRRW